MNNTPNIYLKPVTILDLLMFYLIKFFLNDYANIYYIFQRTEPLGVLVLERCTIELDDEIDNAFIIGK